MKKLNTFLVAFIAALNFGQAQAQDPHVSHHPISADTMKTSNASAHTGDSSETDMALGVIKKIDTNQGKVTMKHGEIKSHQMPPMTMVFKVGSTDMLKGLQAGDEVKFSLDSKMTVTHIEKK